MKTGLQAKKAGLQAKKAGLQANLTTFKKI